MNPYLLQEQGMKSLSCSLIFLLFACSSGTQISPHAGKMILPGKGTDEIHVDMPKAKIIALLGDPERGEGLERWLDYRKKHGLNILLGDGQHAAEIRFCQGFRGRLPSRITLGSRLLDVFKAYGTPAERLEVSQGSEGSKDRMLYNTPDSSKISYNLLGLAFWFSSQKRVIQIAVFQPLPNRNIRTKPEKQGSNWFDK
jgi:hypothetical protein